LATIHKAQNDPLLRRKSILPIFFSFGSGKFPPLAQQYILAEIRAMQGAVISARKTLGAMGSPGTKRTKGENVLGHG
jgi:hypothetical protein